MPSIVQDDNYSRPASPGTSGTWSFEGISKDKMGILVTEINNYCSEIEAKIEEFKASGDISNSVKGTQLEPAVQRFVAAIKEELQAYVHVMKQNVAFATKAYEAYEKVEKDVALKVDDSAATIRSNAGNIQSKIG